MVPSVPTDWRRDREVAVPDLALAYSDPGEVAMMETVNIEVPPSLITTIVDKLLKYQAEQGSLLAVLVKETADQRRVLESLAESIQNQSVVLSLMLERLPFQTPSEEFKL